MDKFAERKKFTSCKLVAAAAAAMCLLGSAGFEASRPRSASCIRSESNSNHFWYSKRLQGRACHWRQRYGERYQSWYSY